MRQLRRIPHASPAAYASHVEQSSPEVAANTTICLIHQANYLLDQQIRQLEQAFVEEGGLRERMTRARMTERARQADPRGGNASIGRKT